MDPDLRTPLVEFFRRREVAPDVRKLAAQGGLPLPAVERLTILMLLCADSEQEIAATASKTLDAVPLGPLRAFLARSDVPADLREFFANRGVEPAAAAAPGSADPGIQSVDSEGGTESEETERSDDPKVLSSLPIVQRMKLAMKGSREQRSQLIRDSNRMVATAVLSSPKLTEAEVEAFTKMGNVSEDVLRIIGTNRNWLKNYGVMLGLVKNPKTPPGISMQLINRLNERDVKMLAVDRNVPEALRLVARKLLVKALR